MDPMPNPTHDPEEALLDSSTNHPQSIPSLVTMRPYLMSLPAAASVGLHPSIPFSSDAVPVWEGSTRTGPPTMNPISVFAGTAPTFQEPVVPYAQGLQLFQNLAGWPIQYTPPHLSNHPPQQSQGFPVNLNAFNYDPVNQIVQTGSPTIQHQPGYATPSLHTQTRGLQCKWEGCRTDATFLRVSDLIRHVKTIHVNRNAYRCAIDGCGRTFGRSDHLRAHQRVHQRRDC